MVSFIAHYSSFFHLQCIYLRPETTNSRLTLEVLLSFLKSGYVIVTHTKSPLDRPSLLSILIYAIFITFSGSSFMLYSICPALSSPQNSTLIATKSIYLISLLMSYQNTKYGANSGLVAILPYKDHGKSRSR